MHDVASSFIAANFPALALAHFLALLSPGPDFFLIVGHAVRRRLRGSFFICVGIALGNALYIILAVAGWSVFRQSPRLYSLLELAGACYLLWLGWMLLRSGRNAAHFSLTALPPLSMPRQLLMGLASALLNPKNAMFYLTLMTAILGENTTLAQQGFAGAWMTALVLVWDTGLAAAIAHPAVQRIVQQKIPVIESVAGVVLMLFAVLVVIRCVA